MIRTKIEKIEKIVFVNKRKYKNYSNQELDRVSSLLRCYLWKKIDDKKTASEYKKLFLDMPTMFEIFDHADMPPRGVLTLLEEQRAWDVEHEELEQEKEAIVERYEKIVKAYIFLRKL